VKGGRCAGRAWGARKAENGFWRWDTPQHSAVAAVDGAAPCQATGDIGDHLLTLR
jgi:hypothetical protein